MYFKHIVYIVSLFLFYSCFTGVEHTGRITAKDVAKVKADVETEEELFFDTVFPEEFVKWKPGKKFFVVDDNIRLIFSPSASYDVSTLELKGDTLEYMGYKFIRQIDNSEDLVVSFSDGENTYRYNTGKTIEEVQNVRPEYVAPFLIDLDYVARVNSLLSTRQLYIKTSLWYDSNRLLKGGLKYVPVEILSVEPGDVVYPFFVRFRYDNKEAGVFMSSSSASVKNMTFDKLFSFSDIRKFYKAITDENWQRIIHGQIAIGMTKDECLLSLGNPSSIERVPTHGGMYEKWSYDNGVYVIFEDGLLAQFRQ